MLMPTSTGTIRKYERVGVLEFTFQGQSLSLGAFIEAGTREIEGLFVPFVDATSGKETYPAGPLSRHPADDDRALRDRLQQGVQPVLRLQRHLRVPVSAAVEPAEGRNPRRRKGPGRMSRALQAIVFDFDGVIANSEPLHLTAFQQALAARGRRAVAGRLLRALSGLRRCRPVRGAGAGSRHRHERRRGQSARRPQGRTDAGRCCVRDRCCFPARRSSFAKRRPRCRLRSPRARCATRSTRSSTPPASPICSRRSWPPATRRRASRRRRRIAWRSNVSASRAGATSTPRRSVAIEDSRWGLESAHGAGLRLVGVTNSYPAHELTGAELVVEGLQALTLPALDRLCAR